MKAKNFLFIIAGLVVALWYGYTRGEAYTYAPLSLYRTVAGLMLGVIAYGIATELSNRAFSPKERIVLTVAEVACMGLTVIMSWYNANLFYMYIILFVLGGAIMLSGVSYTTDWSPRIFNFTNEFMISVYAWQWIVGTIAVPGLCKLFPVLEDLRILVYVAMTVVMSIGTCVGMKFLLAIIKRIKQRWAKQMSVEL